MSQHMSRFRYRKMAVALILVVGGPSAAFPEKTEFTSSAELIRLRMVKELYAVTISGIDEAAARMIEDAVKKARLESVEMQAKEKTAAREAFLTA